MAWVSSAFDDVNISVKDKKRSKSFLKPSKKVCMNPWVDEFPPLTLDEVAIHKKKLLEVKTWITESKIRTKERRILLLTGPPGSSKSAVIHALARELKLSLREWINTYTSNKDAFKEFNIMDQNIESFYKGRDADCTYNQAERFSDFICKASKYKDLSNTQALMSNLILIEEIPNIFMLNSVEFHQLLRKYSVCCTCPLVFIISETNNNNIVKSLFPVELQEELFITNISFNPVSSSLLQSALNRIINLTSNANSSFFDSIGTTKKQFLQTVAEKGGGDVRSAINTLQFIMTKGDETDGLTKKKESKKRSFFVEDFVGRKDSSLVLFRALGKVLYCKREKSIAFNEHKSLPMHLQIHERDDLIENPEYVFERSDSTPSTFNLFLHQNCTPFFSDINDYSSAIGYLSDGDIFNAFWDPTHSLESYASSVSIRGMMHSLKREKVTTPKTFRSLSRPAVFNVITVSNERLQKVKYLNKYLPLGAEELTAVYVPLISKIFCNSENEVDKLTKEIGLIYPPPASKIPNQVLNSSVAETFSQHAQEMDEQEFVIEEFDD